MPSINLLPEDFTIGFFKKREKVIVSFLSFFLVLISVISYGIVEFQRRDRLDKLTSINSQISAIDLQTNSEIESNDLFSYNFNEEDIEKILDEHFYFSEGLNFLKEYIINGVTLSGADMSYDESRGIVVNISGEAENYETAINQVAVFKDCYWADEVNFSSLAGDSEGSVGLSGDLVLKKGLVTYHKQYWDLGVDVLSDCVNRYVKISSYSASLSTKKNSSSGEENEFVVVKFSGKAYNEDELNDFEENLRSNVYFSELKLNKESGVDYRPGVFDFNGTLTLKY